MHRVELLATQGDLLHTCAEVAVEAGLDMSVYSFRHSCRSGLFLNTLTISLLSPNLHPLLPPSLKYGVEIHCTLIPSLHPYFLAQSLELVLELFHLRILVFLLVFIPQAHLFTYH
jgi:hypothetical protein